MSNPFSLFITGVARSGTNLLSRMLSSHPHIMVAVDPFFPLFRLIRNRILEEISKKNPQAKTFCALPFQDYYFSKERIQVMDGILQSDLSLSLSIPEEILQDIQARARYECADLLPFLSNLKGNSCKDFLKRGLSIISKARNAEKRTWVGCKEVWIIELFSAMAKSFSDARFIVIHRDPRAIITSMLAMSKKDPSQRGHILSYLRHFRKYVAFSLIFKRDSLIKDRFLSIKYEDLVKEPEKSSRQVCDFLGVPFDVRMTDSNEFIDFSSGETWKQNSSFEESLSGIFLNSVKRWERELDPQLIYLVNYLCEPEINYLGYPFFLEDFDIDLKSEMINILLEEEKESFSWRSDLGDLQQDLGAELFRRFLLKDSAKIFDKDLVRQSFLFEEVYDQFRQVV